MARQFNDRKLDQIAVIITPWHGSSIPWISTAIGLLLGERGYTINFLIDALPFGKANFFWKLQLAAIRIVMAAVGRNHRIIWLTQSPGKDYISDLDLSRIDSLAKLNAIWSMKGESLVDNRLVSQISSQLAIAYVEIGELIKRENFDLIIVPGGIYGTSGVWVHHAKHRDIRVSSYDSAGCGLMILSVDGVASQLQDIPRAFKMLKSKSFLEDDMSLILQTAKTEINKRRMGKDKFLFQLESCVSKNPIYEGGVLIALNCSWDSAALGLHSVFNSTQEWIIKTVAFLLENTSVPIIVRQHPAERFLNSRTTDDYRKLLLDYFGSEPRIYFIAADDLVNTYDLIEQVLAVVVYTSTVAIEAAIQEKIVITQSCAYYSDLSFIHKASSVDEYFKLLNDAVSGNIKSNSQMMMDDALYCYYLTQCCNWVETPLNDSDTSLSWTNNLISASGVDQGANILLDAIELNIPFAYLRHLKRLSDDTLEEYIYQSSLNKGQPSKYP